MKMTFEKEMFDRLMLTHLQKKKQCGLLEVELTALHLTKIC